MEHPSLYERVTGWLDRHRFQADVITAAFVAFLTFSAGADTTTAGAMPSFVPLPDWFGLTWGLLMAVPLVWARTRPVASTAAMLFLSLTHMALGIAILPAVPADLALPYSLYCVTTYGPRWAPRAGILAALGGCTLLALELQFVTDDEFGTGYVVGIMAFFIFLTAWALGLFRRARLGMLDALRDRAERLQLERDQQAMIATGAERARIAREMHDIVAHSLSIVIAQADGGRYAARHDSAAAERALLTIAEQGRAALADMRKILGVLREGPPVGAPPVPGTVGSLPDASSMGRTTASDHLNAPTATDTPSAPTLLTPQPDLTQIEELAAQARHDGMSISYARIGQERQLPPGIGLNIYRVAQESLTNIRKHAGPSPRVTVLVRWGAREVELLVSDDGRGLATGDGPTAPGSGYGLVGMRERAELFGGSLTAGPKPGGGFRVRFVVPVPAAPDATAPQSTPPDEES